MFLQGTSIEIPVLPSASIPRFVMDESVVVRGAGGWRGMRGWRER